MARSLPSAPNEYSHWWAQQLVDDVQTELLELTQPAQVGYAMTNVTLTRTLDADSTTLAEVADVLATLIDDLKAKGRLG
jgi:hypothetical protein